MVWKWLVALIICLFWTNGMADERSWKGVIDNLVSTIETHSKALKAQKAANPVKDFLPQTIMLPMRDGVELYTKFWSSDFRQLPTVIIRSPYGPDGTENLAYLYIPFGFNIVMQNQRATGDSQGNWTYWHTAANDGFDTMAWITKQSWSNGQVFQMGASADGILSYLDMSIPQPALHGQWLIFSTSLLYYTVFEGGSAYRLNLCHDWLRKMHDFRPSAPDYEQYILHEEGYNSFWDPAMLTNLSNVNFPAIHLAGWYDIFLQPNLESFKNYDTKSAAGALGNQKLIVEPRGHCFFIKDKNDDWFLNDLLSYVFAYEDSLDIFLTQSGRRHLYDIQKTAILDKYTFYVMGPFEAAWDEGDGMYWSTMGSWPQSSDQNFYLLPDRSLSLTAPTHQSSASYNFDPSNAVPTLGGNNLFLDCGPVDQSPVENRSDVMVFTTKPFSDTMVIFGQIRAHLFVSSNCTDTDFTVKITDLYPDGYSALLSDTNFRMRWRENWFNKTLMVPGQVYEIEVKLWSTCYIFNPGHSLRVDISSSNNPRFGVNLNNGNLVYEGGPSLIAQNTIYFGGNTLSHLIVPVVPLSALPDNVL